MTGFEMTGSTLTSAKVHQHKVFFTMEVKVEQRLTHEGCATLTKGL